MTHFFCKNFPGQSILLLIELFSSLTQSHLISKVAITEI